MCGHPPFAIAAGPISAADRTSAYSSSRKTCGMIGVRYRSKDDVGNMNAVTPLASSSKCRPAIRTLPGQVRITIDQIHGPSGFDIQFIDPLNDTLIKQQ
jgi:hypothetical protein